MGGTITHRLIAFSRTDVPSDMRAMVRLSLFDWAACGIAGARDPDFARMAAVQRDGSAGDASLFGGGRASVGTAALTNGMFSHALDYDDTHFAHIGHPSVAVLPCVLAMAEARKSEMADFVDASAIGLEASIRTGIWLGRAHYQTGYHQTATAGAFGATLGAARLLSLAPDQIRHALGLCATMASGLKSQFGTMGKPLNAGLAARTGVEAALWAEAGMTSAPDGLAGPLGFGPTHHGQAIDVPDAGWHFTTVSHKFHACCHGLHAMLEALADARHQPKDVTAITIRTHPRWMTVCNIAEPDTGLGAKFSYAQTAAMRLLGYDTGAPASFSDAVTQDDEVRRLRARTSVLADETLTETETVVIVELTSGGTLTWRHDLLAPMTLRDRSAKLRRKAAALLGQERAAPLWDAAHGDSLKAFADQLVMS